MHPSPHRLLPHFVLALTCVLLAASSPGVSARPAAPAPGHLARAASFDGQWMTPFGPMTLRKAGKQIVGTCGYDKGIKLSGKVKRKTTWLVEVKGHQRGDGEFKLWKGGDQFSGTIKLKSGKEKSWRGYRLRPEEPAAKPGKITTGQSTSGLNLHLRVPKGFSKKKPMPAVALLHGSNMSSAAYVNTFAAAWPDLAKRFILVGFDGENMSAAAKPGRLAFNYSYVNFNGAGRGPEWVQKQSPSLVTDAMDELAEVLPIEKWIVGGHSQGGFLTYAIAMFYPEKVAGVFPTSCNLLVQCDPEEFGDADVRSAQRRVAFAPVHATNDGVVGFSGAQYAYRSFADQSFPALRFFTDERAAHMFAHLPVDDAVRWIDAVTQKDPKDLLEYGHSCLKEEDYGSACAVLDRLEALHAKDAPQDQVAKLSAAIDEAAKPRAETLTAAIRKNADGSWVDDFLAFRRDFEFAEAGQPVLREYAKLRKKHAKPAQKARNAARNAADKATRNELYTEIVEKYYASKWFVHARDWIK